jgi:hypothetical protein
LTRLDRVDRGQRWRPGELDADAGTGLPFRLDRSRNFRPDLDPGDVAQARTTVRRCALQADLRELIGRRRRGWTETVALSICSLGAGRAPSCPAETCAFCARIADVTSSMVSAYLLSFTGSTQMRIAYSAEDLGIADAVHARQRVCSFDTT